MFPSTPFVYTVHPPEVVGDNKLVHPYLNVEVGVLSNNPAGSIVDGEVMSYFTVGGGNNFRYDARLVVEEVPLYRMTKRRAGDGAPEAIPGAADVVGSVPAFSRRAAEVVAGRPRFGGYTRLHIAIAPATSAAFDAAAQPMAVAALMERMEDPRPYQGRVAVDRACFARMDFPMGCAWLDSQTKIEDVLARANILRTDVTMASSLVVFAGKGIGR